MVHEEPESMQLILATSGMSYDNVDDPALRYANMVLNYIILSLPCQRFYET